MAKKEIKLNKLKMMAVPVELAAADTLDQENGNLLEFSGHDDRIVVIVSGSGAEVVFHAGDGIQGGNDLKVKPSEPGKAVVLESGAFMITTGPEKGKVYITGPSTAKVQAIELV